MLPSPKFQEERSTISPIHSNRKGSSISQFELGGTPETKHRFTNTPIRYSKISRITAVHQRQQTANFAYDQPKLYDEIESMYAAREEKITKAELHAPKIQFCEGFPKKIIILRGQPQKQIHDDENLINKMFEAKRLAYEYLLCE